MDTSDTTYATWSYNPHIEFLMVSSAGSIAHAYMQVLDNYARENRSDINRRLAPWTKDGWRPKYPIDGTIFIRTTETRTNLLVSVFTAGLGGMKSYMIITGASVEMTRD